MATLTVGDLKRELSGLSDDTKLSIDGGLTVSHIKRIADDEVVLLFAEVQADLSAQTRKAIKVAFGHSEPIDGSVREGMAPRL